MRHLVGKRILLWGTSLVASAFLAAACGGGEAQPTATVLGGGNLTFGITGWETNTLSSHIAGFIAEQGFDDTAEYIPLASQEEFQDDIIRGELLVMMELWQMDFEAWYGVTSQRENVAHRGTLYEDGIAGWYVPTYVVEANPGLGPVEDLAQYADALGGTFVSCPAAFGCDRLNREKLKFYGLLDAFTVESPASYEALTERLDAAYNAGEPIFAYYREPTWIMLSQDWTRIQEPPYSQICWARFRNFLDFQGLGDAPPLKEMCEYPLDPVETTLHGGVGAFRKEIGTVFFHMNLGREELVDALRYLHESANMDYDAAAIYYLKNNEAKWRSWVDPVAPASSDKISAALAAR